MIHISLRKKTSVAREHKRRNICNFSRSEFFCFLLKWTKSGKEVIYEKKNGGHRAFKRVKLLRCSQSDCLFTLSLIAWHFREDLGPQLSHDATCFYVPFFWKMFAPRCHVCLPSWSAMHDECMTCAKKCAVAMGANVLKTYDKHKEAAELTAFWERKFSSFLFERRHKL